MVARYHREMAINTKTVRGRRVVRYDSLAQLEADVEKLAAADRSGRLKRLGNWSLGQVLGHLATWSDFAFTGYPAAVDPPWFVRLFCRLRKNAILEHGMGPGMRLPNIEGGTLGIEPLTLDEGLARFRSSVQRLRNQAPTHPSPLFGELSHEEWIKIKLRHAEIHLSFMVPVEA